MIYKFHMKYYVNNNSKISGEYEVHRTGCTYLPKIANKTFLGNFKDCWLAVEKAKRKHPTSTGCFYCSRICHSN